MHYLDMLHALLSRIHGYIDRLLRTHVGANFLKQIYCAIPNKLYEHKLQNEYLLVTRVAVGNGFPLLCRRKECVTAQKTL
jgi:hypothetical protein